MEPWNSILVVAAVIERDERFLLTLRPEGTHLAGHWEFPGGKCHAHESHAEALQRELFEELDVIARVGEPIFDITHHYPERVVELHFYRCEIEGEPRPMLGQQMEWVPRHKLGELPFPEADAELIRRLTR
jgi:8-oxo-dGTP diphosphatase